MAKKKVKEIEIDYVKEFMEYVEANKDQFDVKTFENGLRAAEKKQNEYESIGKSCIKLAENIKITFEFTDEEKIINSIKKVERRLGLLQDDVFDQEFEEFTDHEVKSYHKQRKEVFEEGRNYDVLFKKEGSFFSIIGMPNPEVLVKLIALHIKETGSDVLSADTAATLFFQKWKNGTRK